MMRTPMLTMCAAAALVGCGDEAATGGPAAPDNGFYACRVPTDASAPPRFVAIHRDPASGRLALNFGIARPQMLEPVAGTQGALYANGLFAWRLGLDSAVLTDVEAIQTYICRRAGNGGAGLPAVGTGPR